MNSYDGLYGSRFLAATDLKAPVNAVIERIEQETFARDGGPAQKKSARSSGHEFFGLSHWLYGDLAALSCAATVAGSRDTAPSALARRARP